MCEQNSNNYPRKKKYFQYLEKPIVPKRQKFYNETDDESSDDEIVSI